MEVYRNNKTDKIFRTNYYDHLNGYMMTDVGLMSFSDALRELERVRVDRKTYDNTKIIR